MPHNRYGARGIHTAAMRGHIGVINTLVSKGENVDCVTNDNFTALHLAVEAGKATVVEVLLGLGANVHIRVSASWIHSSFGGRSLSVFNAF